MGVITRSARGGWCRRGRPHDGDTPIPDKTVGRRQVPDWSAIGFLLQMQLLGGLPLQTWPAFELPFQAWPPAGLPSQMRPAFGLLLQTWPAFELPLQTWSPGGLPSQMWPYLSSWTAGSLCATRSRQSRVRKWGHHPKRCVCPLQGHG